jgi:hypothetical protein
MRERDDGGNQRHRVRVLVHRVDERAVDLEGIAFSLVAFILLPRVVPPCREISISTQGNYR